MQSVLAPWRRIAPWKRRVAVASLVIVPTVLSSIYTNRQRQAQYAEGREFETGSANEQLATSLETGDVVLFHRNVWDGGRPLRTCLLLLSKYIFGEYDHVAVIIRDRDSGVPYVLEYSPCNGVQFLAFDRRVLNSEANEIAVRKLVCERSPERLDRVDALVRYYRSIQPSQAQQQQQQQQQQPTLPPHTLFTTLRILSHQLWHAVRYGATGGTPAQYVELMGQLLLGAQERIENEARVARLQASLERVAASAASDPAESEMVQAKIARIQASMKRAARRELDLERSLHKLAAQNPDLQGGIEQEKAAAAAAAASSIGECAMVDPSLSAAIAAQVLQVLGVLPVHPIDAAALSCDTGSPSSPRAPAPITPSWSPLPAYSIPRTSYYLPKHFLSTCTLPRNVQPPIAAASPAPSSATTEFEFEWHRELFIKAKNRALRFQQAF